ncbi:MAG: LamG domain-containing protein [Planctomycetia bacterium]|nr:LamG domain-containing protein [Planctomycetia bacterium]
MYWSFDGDSLGQDDTGNGYNLTFTEGKTGTQSDNTPTGTGMSYYSRAEDEVVATATLDSLSMPSFSVSYWINALDPSTHYNVLGANGDWGVFWSHSYTGGLVYIGSTGDTRASVSGLYTEGEWTHITYTYDEGAATVYKNGEQVATHTDAGWESRPAWTIFQLGSAAATDNINGNLDDIAVWTTALSANAAKVLAGSKATPTQLATMTTPTINAVANGVISLSSQQDAYAYAVLQDNPIAYWRLNETEGTQFIDATGYGSNMSIQNGVTLSGGETLNGNSCAKFSAERVQAGVKFTSNIPADAVMSDGYSVEFWLNPDTFVTHHELTSGTDGGDSPNGWATGFAMHTYRDNGDGKFYVGQSGSARITTSDYDTPMTLDAWNYLVYTFDGEVGSLYLDGEMVATKNLAQGGDWGEIWLRNISGAMSDLAIYDYALTAAQISNHYALGNAQVPEPATWGMLLLGLGGILFMRKKRGQA